MKVYIVVKVDVGTHEFDGIEGVFRTYEEADEVVKSNRLDYLDMFVEEREVV